MNEELPSTDEELQTTSDELRLRSAEDVWPYEGASRGSILRVEEVSEHQA